MKDRQPTTQRQQGETQDTAPQDPAERDESGHSQAADAPSMDRVGRRAQADLEAGLSDTSKGAETDAAYEKLRNGGR